jgi:putative ABC transport system permease protein
MSLLSKVRRLRGSFRSAAFEETMDAELRHHLELETEALVARGIGPAEARDLARRRFGSIAHVKDECRDTLGMRAIDVLANDARDALRNLRKYPGYTVLVLFTLALGIGANTAIFSVVHAVLIRPLPYAHGDRLVELRQEAPRLGVLNAGVAVKEIADYRAQIGSLDAVVEYHQMWFNLLGQGDPSRVQTGVVSADFFDILGVQPVLGRTFRAADDAPNAPAVLLLSHAYWQRAFGGDRAIVGRTFEMNDRTHTVVGVLPAIPQFPEENDVYMPPSACPFRSSKQTVENRNARMLSAIGRLRPDATLERLQSDLDTVVKRLSTEYPAQYDRSRMGFRTTALSVHDELTRLARPTLLVLLAATGFVLLLVAANVANLALARVLGRERELALRTALGAGRTRIARQLLTETTLLAVTGGALGLLVGWLVRDLLVAFTSRFTPRAGEIAIDGTVLAFTFGASVVTGLLSGLLPALTLRSSAAAGLAYAGHRTAGGRRLGARNALITTQVAISFVLLVGAGLLARSAIKLQQVDGGFQADRVLTMRIDLDFVKYDDAASRRAFFRSVLEKVAAEPGLQAAALGFTVPLDDAQPIRTRLLVEGRSPADGQAQADLKFTSPAYFQTIGMALLSGRLFSVADSEQAPPVAVVNLSMARHYFPDIDPVGRRVSLDGGRTWVRVVGVVNDVHQYGLASNPTDELYQPFARTGPLSATLLVRTAGDPNAFAQGIPAIVREVDPRQPVSRIQTLEAIRNRSLAPPRLTAMLVALFAVVALVVTAAGIAGVASFSVNQRTTEIGVRMALGAPRASVTGMIVCQGLTPVTAGLGLGLVAALLMTRVVAPLLFAVEPTDPLTYAAVVALLTMVAALACLAPARRAAAIDPISALRMDV